MNHYITFRWYNIYLDLRKVAEYYVDVLNITQGLESSIIWIVCLVSVSIRIFGIMEGMDQESLLRWVLSRLKWCSET